VDRLRYHRDGCDRFPLVSWRLGTGAVRFVERGVLVRARSASVTHVSFSGPRMMATPAVERPVCCYTLDHNFRPYERGQMAARTRDSVGHEAKRIPDSALVRDEGVPAPVPGDDVL
jgi:hypothetical protein